MSLLIKLTPDEFKTEFNSRKSTAEYLINEMKNLISSSEYQDNLLKLYPYINTENYEEINKKYPYRLYLNLVTADELYSKGIKDLTLIPEQVKSYNSLRSKIEIANDSLNHAKSINKIKFFMKKRTFEDYYSKSKEAQDKLKRVGSNYDYSANKFYNYNYKKVPTLRIKPKPKSHGLIQSSYFHVVKANRTRYEVSYSKVKYGNMGEVKIQEITKTFTQEEVLHTIDSIIYDVENNGWYKHFKDLALAVNKFNELKKITENE